MATLLLMRHGKSDWDADYGRDHDRPLNARGVRSARIMGRLLTHESLVPDLVLSSTATRASSTAHLARDAGGWACPIRLEAGFYGGGPDAVLDAVATVDGADRLLVVGHQPTWGVVAGRLTGERVDVRTATVVVVDLPRGWSDVAAGGSLVAVHQPRDHFGGALDDPPGSGGGDPLPEE